AASLPDRAVPPGGGRGANQRTGDGSATSRAPHPVAQGTGWLAPSAPAAAGFRSGPSPRHTALLPAAPAPRFPAERRAPDPTGGLAPLRRRNPAHSGGCRKTTPQTRPRRPGRAATARPVADPPPTPRSGPPVPLQRPPARAD